MAKGVKNLRMITGKYYGAEDSLTKSVALVADIEACIVVENWLKDTSDAEKKGLVTWFWYSPDKKILKKEPGRRFKVSIPKNLCGSYTYYLEASLSGKCDFKSGIYVRGKTEPLINKSKWCIKNDGEDMRKNEFSFGDNVFLGLETEGLNGNWVTIEVYWLNDEFTFDKAKRSVFDSKYDPKADDKLTKVFEKEAWVVKGEINTDFTIQHSWKKGEFSHKFYIKVRNGKDYVLDTSKQNIHARFLRVKNKVVPVRTDIKILNNNAPVKVGELEKKVDSISTCRFKVIKLSERNKTIELFNEGKFINKMDPTSKFYTIRDINYDYDKSNIRSDAKPVLDEIVQFLTKLMPYVPVELGSHTDIRGTDQYNMALSERRAKSVVDYLVKKGVDRGRIHAKGYGKTLPLHAGANISEKMHELNRRTTIKFLISDKDALPIEYSMIAPDIDKALPAPITIEGLSRKGCYHHPEIHKWEMKVIDGFKSEKTFPLKEGANTINYKVYSAAPKLSDFLYSFFLGSRFTHQFFINSCAYYSKTDKKEPKPTLLLTTYPDAVLTQNIRMSYTEPYFWNGVPVELVNNFEWLDEAMASIKKSVESLKEFSKKDVNELSDKIFEFIDEETHKFALGFHFIYNFGDIENRKAPAKNYDYTKENRMLTAIALIIMYIIEIAIILLIIWFTRGKGAFGRIKKFRTFFKTVDKLDDWGFQVVYPKLAENRSMYFESSLGKISRVIEINSKADPLIGVSYEKEVSLLELEGITEKLKKVLDSDTLAKTKLKFEFEGKVFCEFNVKINLGSKKIFVKDFLYGLNSTSGKLTAGVGIAAGASLKGFSIQKEKALRILPVFPPTYIKLEAKLDVELGGYMTYSRSYGMDYNVKGLPTGVYYQDVIFFSGLKGTVHQRVSTKVEDETVFDTNPQDKPVPFTLIKGDTYTFDKVYLFKI
jgi:outer membrane protein OmpA-like peptidoglycan-associated protein